jgi:2-polyprenyl-3-methyl-5-hydroxy-6-metoxy-1,4-benzoquinol methylase
MSPIPQEILASWQINAAAWIAAIDNNEIESRRLATNKAIVQAVRSLSPKSLVDIGCGEGWLCRQLQVHGIASTGTDAIEALIEKARENGGGQFFVQDYQSIINGHFQPADLFDAAVINFALFEEDAAVAPLLRSIGSLLSNNGHLLIQTLHPVVACGDLPYKDGYRPGSWQGFNQQFSNAAPWFFRTQQSWVALLNNNGYHIEQLIEPILPTTQKPASIIFVASKK